MYKTSKAAISNLARQRRENKTAALRKLVTLRQDHPEVYSCLQAVCKMYGVEYYYDICLRTRIDEIKNARQMLYYCVYRTSRFTFHHLRRLITVEPQDHTTLVHSIQLIHDLRKTEEVKKQYKVLSENLKLSKEYHVSESFIQQINTVSRINDKIKQDLVKKVNSICVRVSNLTGAKYQTIIV